MRLPILLFAMAGLAALGIAIVAGGGILTEDEISRTSAPAARPADSQTAPVEANAPPILARPVAPDLVAPPEVEAERLERVEPRAPLGDLALAVPPVPGVPKPTLLHRPVATAAGRLEVEGHSIAIDGVVAVEPGEECRAADGSSWPCGMVARTAFRNWLRGRAVRCVVGEPPASETIVSACGLGRQDVAGWLVENGFATAEAGSAYVEAGNKAEAERRGIFGSGPAVKP